MWFEGLLDLLTGGGAANGAKSTINMGSGAASGDSKWHLRYPLGNAPLGAPLSVAAAVKNTITAALSTGALLSAVAAGNTSSNWATVPPLGINISDTSYSSTAQPFLNLQKMANIQAGAWYDNYTCWICKDSSGNDTGEQAYLSIDGNGYVTSLTASSTPPGGQRFTKLRCIVLLSVPIPPGASYSYRPGTYRIKFKGQGTITFIFGTNDIVSGNGTGTNGLTFTNTTAGAYFTGTITTAAAPNSSAGLVYEITSLGPTDYITDISIVHSSYTTQYDGGTIFDPTFLSTLTNFRTLRFMDPQKTNQEYTYRKFFFTGNLLSGATSATLGSTLSLTAVPGSGATSATLNNAYTGTTGTQQGTFGNGDVRTLNLTNGSTSVFWTTGLTSSAVDSAVLTDIPTVWPWPTATLTALFATGDMFPVTFTLGSSSVNWSTGLRSACTYQHGYQQMIFISSKQNWAGRITPSFVSYSIGGQGWPVETCAALAAAVGADPYLSLPMQYVENEMRSLSTDCTSTFTTVQSYLGIAQKFLFQISNEVWNFAFDQARVAEFLDISLWNQNSFGTNWRGRRIAEIGAVAQTVFGSAFSRVYPIHNDQAANGGFSDAMNTPFWFTSDGYRAYNYPVSNPSVKRVSIAPYFGESFNTADQTYFDSLATQALKLTELFSLQYTNVGNSGHTYTTLPSGGFFGVAQTWVNNWKGYLTSFPRLTLMCYEGSQGYQMPTADISNGFLAAAERDSRMGTQVLNWLHWWATNVGATEDNIQCVFSHCVGGIGTYGAWGHLESQWQTPLSSVAKYNALVTYINGG